MITNLSKQRHVKICVSSRPLLAFEMAFKNKPSLRLQDLTFETIREYTEKQLSPLVQQYATPNGEAQQRAEKLLRMIVQRADGVFLWAVIATREVRDGLQGMVNLDELAQAIEILPPELEGLFILVLGRIKRAFRRDAAKFLQIVLFKNDMHHFDLCRLHLISSQQELQDAPFVYENVAMSELTEACRTLETRLLSHTAGLLELTQASKTGPPYCKRKDWDPISFTRVEFIHRTVRDFLMDNNEAKSFLREYGLSEAQVHLCIARGTLAYLAQHSQGDAVPYKYVFHPMLYPFLDVLRHVSIAERLFGCAQSKFIQSLDYGSLARGYTIGPPRHRFRLGSQAFCKDWARTLIDMTGMAAAAGMTIYVCEQLGLSVSSTGYNPSLPDLEKYSTSRAATATLSWKMLDQLPDTSLRGETLSRRSTFRQALSKCLQWEEDTQAKLWPDDQTQIHQLAESYILCCCCQRTSISVDLVRILLKAGANPMVRVRPKSPIPELLVPKVSSFWQSWLEMLLDMRHNYMVANGKSGGLLFEKDYFDRPLTVSDIFGVTKALLANGADINYQVEYDINLAQRLLKRRDLPLDFKLGLSCSAMFVLKECFDKEPEFRKFALTVSPLIETPTRRIRRLYRRQKPKDPNSTFLVIHLPSADESKLWPIVEKWEETGDHRDRAALATAMEQIWKVLYSEKLKEESEEESKEQLKEESEVKHPEKSNEESN